MPLFPPSLPLLKRIDQLFREAQEGWSPVFPLVRLKDLSLSSPRQALVHVAGCLWARVPTSLLAQGPRREPFLFPPCVRWARPWKETGWDRFGSQGCAPLSLSFRAALPSDQIRRYCAYSLCAATKSPFFPGLTDDRSPRFFPSFPVFPGMASCTFSPFSRGNPSGRTQTANPQKTTTSPPQNRPPNPPPPQPTPPPREPKICDPGPSSFPLAEAFATVCAKGRLTTVRWRTGSFPPTRLGKVGPLFFFFPPRTM